jgi:hypothetical protein
MDHWSHSEYTIDAIWVLGTYSRRPHAGDVRNIREERAFPLTDDFPFAAQIRTAAEDAASRAVAEHYANGDALWQGALQAAKRHSDMASAE